MKNRKEKMTAAAAILVLLAAPASAHRVDEYLQATVISLEKNRVEISMRLVPGIAVSSIVLAAIDTNADGTISAAEQQAYARQLQGDLSLTIDGTRLSLKLVSMDFPKPEEMNQGLGQIHIKFTADLPSGGPNRKLAFENHHQKQIAAYLMNCLVPTDPDISIVTQNRNEDQSFYEVEYVQAGLSK